MVRHIDNGDIGALVLLDLSSAFDTVNHDILSDILQQRFAVTDTCFSWFSNYLSDRTQSFSSGRHQTAFFPVQCSVPQGSVLGPVEFIAYTEDITTIFQRHGVPYHLYADDKQVYAFGRVGDLDVVRNKLVDCINDISAWCASRRLQLNSAKTELIWFGSRSNLHKMVSQNLTLAIGDCVIEPVNVVRDLGVMFDGELNLHDHIDNIARSCFFHIRRLWKIRPKISQDVAAKLAVSLIMSRLDYCNSILAGLPESTIQQLQRVQNAAARFVFKLRLHDHVKPALMQLHWLPVRYRIDFKLCCLMHQVVNGRCPQYLADMVATVQSSTRRTGLRSADMANYYLPRLRTKFGERAFSYAGPRTWNSLPLEVRLVADIPKFKRLLKTYFFRLAYDVA